MIQEASSPAWLAIDGLLAQFATQRREALQRYVDLVAQGVGQESIWNRLNGQICLGDDNFLLRMQDKIKHNSEDVNFPKAQRRTPALPLNEYQKSHPTRNEAIVAAYSTSENSYQALADFFNLHFTTVGKIVREAKKNH